MHVEATSLVNWDVKKHSRNELRFTKSSNRTNEKKTRQGKQSIVIVESLLVVQAKNTRKYR